MSWKFFIALRYLTSRRKEKFISVISLISIAGVAVGVAALIVVIAVMSGFDNDLKGKIIGTNSHMTVESDYGVRPDGRLIAAVLKTDRVVAAAYFLSGQALVRHGENVTGVIMKGIEPRDEVKVTRIGSYIVSGSLSPGRDGIVIGSELSRRLGAGMGDHVTVISPACSEGRLFKVCGIFTSGMYEYDSSLIYVSIPSAQELLSVKGLVSGVEVKADDAFDVNAVKKALKSSLGAGYRVRTWMDLNRNFLAALKMEKTVMFIILTLIVMVACFNIASALIMTVLEKTRDIGVLKTIGASNLDVMEIFALQGGMIGVLGTALGAAFGSVLCYLLKTYKFISLPKDIYYIDKLPVNLQLQDVTVIVASSLAITLLATVYPSLQAARLDPVEVLRYE